MAVAVVVADVMGLCSVICEVAFNFKSIKGQIGILTLVNPPLCVPLPYTVAVGWHKQSFPCM